MDQLPENELVEEVRKGSSDALGELLRRRQTKLMGFLRHITGDHLLKVLDLDDLFQELCQSALKALAKIPKEDLDIDRWLEQLARRRVVDAHREHFGVAKRSQARNQIFSQIPNSADPDSPGIEQLLIASMTSPSMALSRNWRMASLHQAVATLDQEHQRLLELRFRDGLPTGEIAERLGKSDAAVRVALSRILDKLQAILLPKK